MNKIDDVKLPTPFNHLIRGLISIPKAELDAEERKYEKAKLARAKRIAKAQKKK